ncbi:hypothetical protein [Methanococcoides sp. AM1]|uniref:hypothetical protein n=1 Tax=Methanococcoides sp. AM1 TaxID=1201011 RepID=UPI001082AEAD|nr:hypothetical protein [Methanococcoides sp. AM1]
MKKYNDNSLKSQILNAVHKLGDNAISRKIRELIEYKGSNSNFKSEIYALKRRGYLSFAPESKDRKVKQYILTKKGKFHRLQPDYYQRMKVQKLNATVHGILNDDEKFTAAVDSEVDNRMEIIEKNVESIITGSANNFSEPTSKGEMTVANIIAKKDKEIKTWQSRYFNQVNSRPVESKINKTTQRTAKKNTDEKRIEDRKKLANHYYQKKLWLDFEFFSQWKNMVPVLLSGKKFLNKRSVEIMSIDEAKREMDRGHTRAILQSNDEILACCFRIDKINKDGIVVKSDRLDLKKNMKW